MSAAVLSLLADLTQRGIVPFRAGGSQWLFLLNAATPKWYKRREMMHARTFTAAFLALSITGYSRAQTAKCTTWNLQWFPNGARLGRLEDWERTARYETMRLTVTWCCDPRLWCGWQRDWDAWTHWRLQRTV